MVTFNVEEEGGFLSSLDSLGGNAADDILGALDNIVQQNLSWHQFVANHGWTPVQLQGEATYPGADPLYWFAVTVNKLVYQIAAKGPYGSVVVCSAALRP